MDIWIIQNGEKAGPIHDFEVRKKIEAGELAADTPAWHEGLSAWRPLVEIDLFSREFDQPIECFEEPAPAAEDEPEPDRLPPPLQQPHLIRRFWARWFDLYLFAGVWWLAMWAAGRDIGATLNNPWIILFHYIPWFVLEIILLHRFGSTPGKWLLGIKVVNDDGSLLSLAQATRRSARVLFLGIGFGWGVLALICQIMAFFTTRKLGRPLWDHSAGHRLDATPLHPLRLVVYVIGLFAALQLQMIVVAPYVMESMRKSFPALSEQLEKNPPWHLPEKR
ncbi:MAG: RDD family protein [Verrucomicrobiaceae bacterium]|nr:MAG: RDD family protein [Verrucomicrobiaceae bacterium]